MFTKGQRQCLKKSWTLTPALDKSLTMSLSLTREIKLCPLFNQKRKAAFQPALLPLRSVFGYETEAYRACTVLFESCLSVDYRSIWMSPICNSPQHIHVCVSLPRWVHGWPFTEKTACVDVWVKILTSLLKAKCLYISGEEQRYGKKHCLWYDLRIERWWVDFTYCMTLCRHVCVCVYASRETS